MVIYSGVCYTQRKFFGDKDAHKMNSERLVNEQRLALLKTIRKENPSLRRYMNDIINVMENPESAFNTEKMTQPTDLDRTTAMRLCDAFAVAKMYSEKYHLDFPELIEFVSEKTLEILEDGKITSTAPFKERMKYLIRQQFTFRNPLLSRSGRRNMLSYELADKEIWGDGTDKDENSHSNDNWGLKTPILFTNNANISCSELEFGLELKEEREKIESVLKSLIPQEENVIRWRFGLNDGEPRTLEDVGKIFGMSREYIRLKEAKAVRKLHSRKCISVLNGLLQQDEICTTPIGRGTTAKKRRSNHFDIDNFNIMYWKPYCACKHRMNHIKSALINNKRKMVFYCQSCGNIYSIQNGRLKKVEGYCLMGYSSSSSYDQKRWPMVHWDKTESAHNDFEKRYKALGIRYDIQYYTRRIQLYYGNDYNVRKEKEYEIIKIYNLASEDVISVEDAFEKCKEVLLPDKLNAGEI